MEDVGYVLLTIGFVVRAGMLHVTPQEDSHELGAHRR